MMFFMHSPVGNPTLFSLSAIIIWASTPQCTAGTQPPNNSGGYYNQYSVHIRLFSQAKQCLIIFPILYSNLKWGMDEVNVCEALQKAIGTTTCFLRTTAAEWYTHSTFFSILNLKWFFHEEQFSTEGSTWNRLDFYLKSKRVLLWGQLKKPFGTISFSIVYVSKVPYSPSLLLTLAKPGPWLLDNCEELLKEDWGRLDTSGPSQLSIKQTWNTKQRISLWALD